MSRNNHKIRKVLSYTNYIYMGPFSLETQILYRGLISLFLVQFLLIPIGTQIMADVELVKTIYTWQTWTIYRNRQQMAYVNDQQVYIYI
jgi:hypothetical protein